MMLFKKYLLFSWIKVLLPLICCHLTMDLLLCFRREKTRQFCRGKNSEWPSLLMRMSTQCIRKCIKKSSVLRQSLCQQYIPSCIALEQPVGWQRKRFPCHKNEIQLGANKFLYLFISYHRPTVRFNIAAAIKLSTTQRVKSKSSFVFG